MESSVQFRDDEVSSITVGRTPMNAIRTLRRQTRKLLVNKGVLGSLLFAGARCTSAVKRILKRTLATSDSSEPTVDQFDRTFHVETSAIVPLTHLDVEHPSWVHGVRYQPIWPIDFRELLEGRKIDFEHTCFIDIGSGKGRALLLASRLPFKRIVGVEFSEQLIRVAAENLRWYRDSEQVCHNIELVCADATEYELPDEPLLLYMYNPFAAPVMTRFIQRVLDSFARRPRRITVVYFNPVCAALWRKVESLRVLKEDANTAIYDIFSGAEPMR
jgi:tRNA A58 N-methylase Trm61